MKHRFVLIAKLAFGVLPSVGGALLALLGITKMIQAQLSPSEIFGRPPFTIELCLVLVLLVCIAAGGVACGVAWLKEWHGNEEKNRWLIAGLVAALLGVCAVVVWAAYIGTGAWPLIGIAVGAVLLSLLRRESRLTQ